MAVFEINTIVKDSRLTKRGHTQIMNRVFRAAGKRHIAKNLRKHFESSPENRPGTGGYKIARRSRKYLKRKREKVGHIIPNLFSGALRDIVLITATVRATAKRFTVSSKGPHPLKKQRRAEIEAVTPRELKDLGDFMGKFYGSLAKLGKYQTKTARRSK